MKKEIFYKIEQIILSKISKLQALDQAEEALEGKGSVRVTFFRAKKQDGSDDQRINKNT